MGGAPYKSAKEGVGALSSVSENKLTTFKFFYSLHFGVKISTC